MIPRRNNGVAVTCHNLKKTYGEGQAAVQALRQVDLEVRSGELLMLVGPSGCGKTTLISIIAGILDQSEGDCLVFDQDFKSMRVQDKTRYRGQNIGFVFQAYNLIPALTAAEPHSLPGHRAVPHRASSGRSRRRLRHDVVWRLGHARPELPGDAPSIAEETKAVVGGFKGSAPPVVGSTQPRKSGRTATGMPPPVTGLM